MDKKTKPLDAFDQRALRLGKALLHAAAMADDLPIGVLLGEKSDCPLRLASRILQSRSASARRSGLSPGRSSEISRQAALMRWAKHREARATTPVVPLPVAIPAPAVPASSAERLRKSKR